MKFFSLYEDNKTNININKLELNTNFEIRICAIFDNNQNIYSDIIKFKKKEFDSIILKETKKDEELLNKIYE